MHLSRLPPTPTEAFVHRRNAGFQSEPELRDRFGSGRHASKCGIHIAEFFARKNYKVPDNDAPRFLEPVALRSWDQPPNMKPIRRPVIKDCNKIICTSQGDYLNAFSGQRHAFPQPTKRLTDCRSISIHRRAATDNTVVTAQRTPIWQIALCISVPARNAAEPSLSRHRTRYCLVSPENNDHV